MSKIYKECKQCDEVYEVVRADDNGICSSCKEELDCEDEEIFVSEPETFEVNEIDEYPVDDKFKEVLEYDE